jgi:hypothetical protein
MHGRSTHAWRAIPLLFATGLPAQGLRFATEQHSTGGCFSQAGTIMHLETSRSPADGGSIVTVAVHDTVPGEAVLLFCGDSGPNLGGSYLPAFTHGPYLTPPEYFGPWCGWYTNGGAFAAGRANAPTTTFQVRLPVPPAACLDDFLWWQALMTDPTPGWRQGWVTSRPIRLRVVR